MVLIRPSSLTSAPALVVLLAFGGGTLGGTVAGRHLLPQASLAQPSTVAALSGAPPNAIAALSSNYPADLIRVLDGDTFEARVRIWLDLDITTRIRLRGIDAPECKARCAEEQSRAETATLALIALLQEGGISIRTVGRDKYGGRVLANAATALTPDVSAALLAAGVVRPCAGGRRRGWCGLAMHG